MFGARSRPDLWPQWAQQNRAAPADWAPTLAFDNTVLAIQAAAEGLGLAVLPELFIAGMLDAGTLRAVRPQRIETGAYAVAIGRRRESARVLAFVDWLHATARA